jgi:hypothetical protein
MTSASHSVRFCIIRIRECSGFPNTALMSLFVPEFFMVVSYWSVLSWASSHVVLTQFWIHSTKEICPFFDAYSSYSFAALSSVSPRNLKVALKLKCVGTMMYFVAWVEVVVEDEDAEAEREDRDDDGENKPSEIFRVPLRGGLIQDAIRFFLYQGWSRGEKEGTSCPGVPVLEEI